MQANFLSNWFATNLGGSSTYTGFILMIGTKGIEMFRKSEHIKINKVLKFPSFDAIKID